MKICTSVLFVFELGRCMDLLSRYLTYYHCGPNKDQTFQQRLIYSFDTSTKCPCKMNQCLSTKPERLCISARIWGRRIMAGL